MKESAEEKRLYIAQFLTTFWKHYIGSDECLGLGRPISPRDVQEALDYRFLLHSSQQTSTELAFWKHNYVDGDKETLDRILELQEKVDNCNELIEKSSEDTKIVHRMIRRFEVWSTQEIANEMLMPKPDESQRVDGRKDDGLSPLLNLPSALYFAQSLQQIDLGNKDAIKSKSVLGISPSNWNWEEYLRLSYLVGLLPKEAKEKAMSSPLTAVSPRLGDDSSYGSKKDRRHPMMTSESDEFTPSDLVALWVRAQRNSDAFRHLIQLFSVKENSERKRRANRIRIQGQPGTGKTLVQDRGHLESASLGDNMPVVGKLGSGGQSDREFRHGRVRTGQKKQCRDEDTHPESDGGSSYQATFKGNHSRVANRLKESPLIDFIVEWAVINQVLFTNSQIRRSIEHGFVTSTSPPVTFRFDESDELGSAESAESNKRPRPEEQSHGARKRGRTGSREVLVARQCFVLRWFARRNRRLLSIVFLAKSNDNPVHQGLVDELAMAGVPLAVKQTLEADHNSTDRTLARIDRRARRKMYADGPSFLMTIRTLLKALEGTLKKDESLWRRLKDDTAKAWDDLDKMWFLFLDAPYTSWESLLDQNERPKIEAELLLSIPPPWVDTCSACREKVADTTAIRICDNCERTLHCNHKACKHTFVTERLSWHDIVKSYSPLAQVFTVQVPDRIEPPAFRESHSIQWTKQEFSVSTCGQRLGLLLQNLSECEKALFELLSGRLLANALDERPFTVLTPLSIKWKGMIVVDVLEGTQCEKLGLMEGDVITGVLTKRDGALNFEGLCDDEIIPLLTKQHEEFVLQVQRTDTPVLELGRHWMRCIRERNDVSRSVLSRRQSRYVCLDCTQGVSHESDMDPFEEARRCRAVIRRLGMESYCGHFLEDGLNSRHEHGKYASLRRLDQMMQSILCWKTKQFDKAELESPFHAPSEAGDPKLTRLSWAPPEILNTPFVLLCKGIHLMLTSVPDAGIDSLKDEREALATHFLSLFTSWCLGLLPANRAIKTKGPPIYAYSLRRPWLVDLCILCLKPMADKSTSRIIVCPDCLGSMRATIHARTPPDEVTETPTRNKTQEGKNAQSPTTSAMLKRYEWMASFVGSLLLVLPEDALVRRVSRATHMTFEHEDRPVAFVVISYLPSCYVEPKKAGHVNELSNDNEEGLYHLLPIINWNQLHFLHQKAGVRREPDLIKSQVSWVDLQVVELDGVVCMSPSILQERLKETNAIVDAIDDELTCLVSLSTDAIKITDVQANDHAVSISHPYVLQTPPTSVLERTCFFIPREVPSYREQWEDSILSTGRLIADNLLSIENPSRRVIVERVPDQVEPMSVKNVESTNEQSTNRVDENCEVSASRDSFHEKNRSYEDPTKAVPSSESKTSRQEVTPPITSNVTTLASNQGLVNTRNRKNGSQTQQPESKEPNAPRWDRRVQERSTDPPQVLTVEQQRHARATVPGQEPARNTVRVLEARDLHRRSAPELFLSTVEAAIASHFINERMPILATRLLCPRYAWSQAVGQIGLLSSKRRFTFPRLHQDFRNFILRADYVRAEKEEGPHFAYEQSFRYRIPQEPLPLDRCFESFLMHKRSGRNTPQGVQDRSTGQNQTASGTSLPSTQVVGDDSFVRRWGIAHRAIRPSPQATQRARHPQLGGVGDNSRLHGSAVESTLTVDLTSDSEDVSQSMPLRGRGSEGSTSDHESGGETIRYLQQIPRSDWGGRFVSGKCWTTRSGSREESHLIGSVKANSLEGSESTEDLQVNVIYIDNFGLLQETVVMTLALQHLKLIAPNSVEDNIVRKWNETYGTPQNQSPQLLPVRNDKSELRQSSGEFSTRLWETLDGPRRIGLLPDGRVVLWFHCDPTNLYLKLTDFATPPSLMYSSESEKVCAKRLSSTLATVTSCGWGCGQFKSSNYVNSPMMLSRHIREKHTFGDRIGTTLERVNGGFDVLRFASAIVSEICRRDRAFLPFKDTSDNGIAKGLFFFKLEELVSFSHDYCKQRSKESSTEETLSPNGSALQLVRIYTQLAHLFDIPKSGASTQVELEHVFGQRQTGSKSESGQPPCFDDMFDSGDDTLDRSCHLCLPWSGKNENLREKQKLIHGFSEHAFLDAKSDFLFPADKCGLLMISKQLLLRLGMQMPRSLRQSCGFDHSASVQLADANIWDELRFQQWCGFVLNSFGLRSLAQALVTLIASLNRNKLPRWWHSTKAGWSSCSRIMQSTSLRCLILYIDALHAAVMEYGVDDLPGEVAHVEARSCGDDDKNEAWQKALEMGMTPFSGTSNDHCIRCRDGGELLCCEYCELVQHGACCDPAVNDIFQLETWICDRCRRDISEVYATCRTRIAKEGTLFTRPSGSDSLFV